MQTILGASGQIGQELARALKRDFTDDIRLVSRTPRKVNDTDHLHRADLLDPAQTISAVEGSDIVYLTAGLPMDTKLWVEQWPVMMRNVIDACAAHSAKLVFSTTPTCILRPPSRSQKACASSPMAKRAVSVPLSPMICWRPWRKAVLPP